MPGPRRQKSKFSPIFKPRKYSTAAAGDNQELNDTRGVLVIGGVGLDLVGTLPPRESSTGQPETQEHFNRVSNPGSISTNVGGVAKNIATTMSQLDKNSNVRLVSAIGKDLTGISVLQDLHNLGLDISEIKISNRSHTARYMATNSADVSGGLAVAVADMDIIKKMPKDVVTKAIEKHRPRLVCFDGNLSSSTIKALCEEAKSQGAMVVCEPTSQVKAGRIGTVLADFTCSEERKIDMISPNEMELKTMYESWAKPALALIATGPPISKGRRKKFTSLANRNKTELENFCKSVTSLAPTKTSFSSKMSRRKRGGKDHAHKNYIYTVEPYYPISRMVRKSIELLQVVDTILLKLGENGVLAVRNVNHPNLPIEADFEDRLARKQYFPAFEKYVGISEEEAESTPEENHPEVHASMFIPVRRFDATDMVVGVQLDWWPAPKLLRADEVVNSNGAGDSFLGGFVQAMLSAKESEEIQAERKLKPWEFYGNEYMKVLVEKGQQVALSVLRTNESHFVADESLGSLERGREDIDFWKTMVARFGEFEEIMEVDEEGDGKS
ncbi:hypothetical protein TWF694_006866 [Orbilia ellipsospora]|uniref:Carbohydrate kinase PfkB domain-containing protein n=1 Tax=Orbilia ellipsospora TaxID=2528407 RepID=A0AAV9XT68_9PEZI